MEHEDIYQRGEEGLPKKMVYYHLLNELKVMIECARFRDAVSETRTDRLKCQGCGVHEDDALPFILIDRAVDRIDREAGRCCLTAYDYICPVCGLRQASIVKTDQK